MKSPAEARGGVARVQGLLADEQQRLHRFIDRTRHLEVVCVEPAAGRFDGLAERLRSAWGPDR